MAQQAGQQSVEATRVCESDQCAIVLVCGFLSPGNAWWIQKYWGKALELGQEGSPVLTAPVSSVASVHDRACELFAVLKGQRVDYGKEHAEKHGHQRFGIDYTGRGLWPSWGADRPVHLVGHSFGGNTVRALRFMLATDAFNVGSNSLWVRSTSTISSPLNGSLITYKLGANEDHKHDQPVWRFTPGYNIGIGVHFYELFARKLGLDRLVDFGMRHWELEEGGFKLFFESLLGGENGGGTPSVCSRDNAAHDMTVVAALEWAEKVRTVMEADPDSFEFNFVASKKAALDTSLRDIYHNVKGVDGPFWYKGLLAAKELAVSIGARLVNTPDSYDIKHNDERYDVSHLLQGEFDGLCSKSAQYDSIKSISVADLERVSLAPGQYTVFLEEKHDHFSIVPWPECQTEQHDFFKSMFQMLRSLPCPTGPLQRVPLASSLNSPEIMPKQGDASPIAMDEDSLPFVVKGMIIPESPERLYIAEQLPTESKMACT